jgi:hypothetical protein
VTYQYNSSSLRTTFFKRAGGAVPSSLIIITALLKATDGSIKSHQLMLFCHSGLDPESSAVL